MKNFVDPMTPYPSRYVFGLDIGQARNHTAFAGIQITDQPKMIRSSLFPSVQPPFPDSVEKHFYTLRFLERFPLGVPYSQMLERVAEVMTDPALGRRPTLVLDASSVGRPVLDMLKQRKMGVRIVPVTITGGWITTQTGAYFNVPKTELVSSMITAMETSSLRIPASLKTLPLLKEEILNFRTVVSKKSRTVHFGAASGAQDDLVIAVALALWYARPKGPIGELGKEPIV